MSSQRRVLIASFGVLFVLAFTFFIQTATAQVSAGAQAIGQIGKGGVTGLKSTIWTAEQATQSNNWVASPVALCTTLPPCSGSFVETGYIKGQNIPGLANNVLQQYSSWDSPSGGDVRYGLGNLSDNALYTFTVVSQPSNNRWAIKRDGALQWTWAYGTLGFSAGRMVGCGAEAARPQTTIAVQCSQMQYQYQGVYTLFNWTFPQTIGNYCVFKPFEYGATGWGPC